MGEEWALFILSQFHAFITCPTTSSPLAHLHSNISYHDTVIRTGPQLLPEQFPGSQESSSDLHIHNSHAGSPPPASPTTAQSQVKSPLEFGNNAKFI